MDFYAQIKALAAKDRKAKTNKEKEGIEAAMSDLQNQNPQEYKDALERLIRETAQEYEELTMYEKLGDIARMLSMSYIAKTYFGKSRSWLAQKLHANMVNGEPAKFTDAELATLKAALDDISKKIGSVSSTL